MRFPVGGFTVTFSLMSGLFVGVPSSALGFSADGFSLPFLLMAAV